MNAQSREQLKEIALKVKKLRQLYGDSQEQVQSLQNRVYTLESQLEKHKNEGGRLEELNKNVKLAEAISLCKADIQQHKKLLAQQIREIDMCIRLLSEK